MKMKETSRAIDKKLQDNNNQGKALKFYSSIRCQVSRVGGSMEKVKIGGEEVTVGHMVRVKTVKNKTAPPFRKAEFMIKAIAQVVYNGNII